MRGTKDGVPRTGGMLPLWLIEEAIHGDEDVTPGAAGDQLVNWHYIHMGEAGRYAPQTTRCLCSASGRGGQIATEWQADWASHTKKDEYSAKMAVLDDIC